MEKDFDKEIDAILRGAAKGINLAESPKNHLDADEISLFAEGLLPMNARSIAIEHFADCNNCRSVLVDVVSFREETADVPSVNLVGAKTGFAESLRKLFSFPQLGIAMGALTLLFVGVVSFVALKNNNQTENNLAKAEKPSDAVSPAIANKLLSDTGNSTIVAANSSANSAPANSATTAANNPFGVPQKPIDTNTASRLPKSGVVEPRGPNSGREDDLSAKKEDSPKDESPTLDEKLATREPARPESLKISPSPSVEDKVNRDNIGEEKTRSAPAKPKKNPAPASGVSAGSNASKARSVGGKSFSNSNGTWVDSEYKGGATKTVNRGTKTFNKLDSELKNIANNFTEPIIVVWKANNYRIQ